jgi:nicotinic acetylcholine receptor, invertebrate
MSWSDERLVWNASEYDDITEITLPVNTIWIPDIVLQNGVGRNDYLNEFKYFNPWVSNKGLITWVPEVRLNTRCSMNIRDFPFDKQCCEINLYSWAHTDKQMKIQQYGNKNVTNTTHLSQSSQWHIYYTCATHKIIETNDNLHWWVTSYVIYIKRHTVYHIYTLLMPGLVLSSLSILLFLLPPDSGEKIALGVTILLAFFVNSLVVSNYTPESTNHIPVIGLYYAFNIALCSLSICMSVIFLNFHFRGHKENRLPRWISRVLMIQESVDSSEKLISMNRFEKNRRLDLFLQKQKELKPSKVTNEEEQKRRKSKTDHMKRKSLASSSDSPVNLKRRSRNVISLDNNNDENYIQTNSNCSETYKSLEKIYKTIKMSAQLLDYNFKYEKTEERINYEWKEAARRIDLILFFTSSVAVVLTPVILFGEFFLNDFDTIGIKKCNCDSFSSS